MGNKAGGEDGPLITPVFTAPQAQLQLQGKGLSLSNSFAEKLRFQLRSEGEV